LPYQSALDTTTFLAAGTNGQVLTLASGVPSWATPTTGTVTSVGGTGTVSGITLSGTVTSTGSLTLGGTLDLSSPPAIGSTTPNTGTFSTLTVNDNATLGSSNTDTVAFTARINTEFTPATDNTYDLGRTGHEWRDLYIDGTANIDSLIADTADINAGTIDNTIIGGTTPLAGTFTDLRVNNTISLAGSTGTSGYVLTSNGASAPTWQANANGLAITDDTTTNATRYLTFTSATSGSITGANVSSTQLAFNPSTGNLGIGTSSPVAKFVVSNSGAGGFEFNPNASGVAQLETYNRSTSAYVPMSLNGDDIRFRTGSSIAERMRIDSSGNVGIGLTSFNQKLTIGGINANNNTNQNSIEFQDTNGNPNFRLTGGRGANGNEGYGVFSTLTGGTMTEQMRIDSAGNVGIGVSPSAVGSYKVLQIRGASTSNGGLIELETSDGTSGVMEIFQSSSVGRISVVSNLPLAFNTNNTERMRILSGGNVGIGKTTAGENAASGNGFGFSSATTDPYFTIVNANASGGNACAYLNRRTSGQLIAFLTNDGTTDTNVGSISHNGTNTAYNTSSDYRLKENIAPMTGALAKVSALKPCTYTWKSTGANGQGFIAHELQEVFSDAVTGEKDALDKDGNIAPQGIDTSYLVATLTAGIQEQQALIENLTTRLNALEGK
jgi:hypothetical protein